MHVAAQGDQMRILAFLKGFGMSFVGKDYKGATPLHWAAYLGCEMAASVLISWKAEINCRDSHGYTPLHLAAIAGNPRITRILMLKGANQNISDYKGRTPLDFAMEFGFTHIISLLSKPSFLSLCGIKPPQRPIHCKRLLMYLYISLLSLSISTNLFILHINSYDYLILSSLQVIFFIIIANKNPGYIEKNGKSLLELCEEYESSHICPDCIVRRLPRSRHCQSCEKCIEKFDHHCPWINTCIGAQNLGIFYCFILATFALLISSGYHDLMFLINFYNLQETFQLNIEICIAAVWTFIATGFFFPLLLLLLVQTRNFLSNTTTNERFSRNPGMPAERNDSDSNVNRENTCKNVLEMCCNLNPAIEKPNNRVMENNSLKFTMIASDYEESLSYSNSS